MSSAVAVVPGDFARRKAPRHPDAVGESRKTSFVGMVMALASWTMLFASFFLVYALMRLRAPMWPPEGILPLPKLLPGFNTLVLLASSVVLHLGVRERAEERPGSLARALGWTFLLGSVFLALQLFVWVSLWRQGLTISSGGYGSVFYGLTVFHAVHVLAGLVALACVVPGARAGRFVSGRQSTVRVTAMFWHFVDVVWLLMFVAVYLI